MMNKPQHASAGPGSGGWYAAALVLHALALAAVVWLTPLREMAGLEPARPEAATERMSAREIRQVSQTVEQATASRLTRQLERLDEIRRELAQLEKERLDMLRRESPQSETDPQQALAAMREAQKAMQHSAEVMQESQETSDTERTAQLDSIDKHLDESSKRLPVLEPQYRPVMAALDRTRSLQDRARQAWTRSQNDEDNSDLERAQRDAEKRAEEYRKKLAEAEKKDQQVIERRAKVEEEREKLAGLARDRDAATEERDIRRLDDKIRQQEQRIADRERQVNEYAAKAVEYREQLAGRQAVADAAQAAVQEIAGEVRDTQAAALDWERQAIAAQQEAIASMERAMQGEMAPAEMTIARPEDMTPEQAYELAREREREIAETYKTWRAAQLAMLRQMPLAEALRQTDVVRPERPDLDTSVPQEGIDSATALEQRKRQLENVLQETGSMVSLAETLLGMSRRQTAAQGEGYAVSLERMRERSEAMARLASVDVSGRIADMTALGTGRSGSGAGRAGQGGESSRTPGENAGSGMGQGSSGNGEGMGAGQGSGRGGGAGTGDARFSSGGSDGFTPPQEINTGRLDAFSRKIDPAGDPARWMSINSWYIIGPFANPGRSNIDRQFPPESVIDLDASYIGKDDQIIRWEYQPSERAEIVPRNEEPYGIWYATTELWSDSARDVWLAMGSDDQGQLWVNGQLVWISASRHKDWTIGEALRRVHLEAGRNRILYRIENGHGGMAFSLCILLDDQM